MKKNEPLAGREKKCPVCGKEFFAGSEWVYVRGYESKTTAYICSWKCLNKFDEEKKNGSHKKKRTERSTEIPENGDEAVFGGW